MNLGHEDERREFKKSTSEMKEAMASIAAILNKHGFGELFFGVSKNGEVCGQDVSEATLREISQAVGNYIEPAIYPSITHEITADGKDYVKVAFSGDRAPYSCRGQYRIRVADEDVLMRSDELRVMFRAVENRINPWDGCVSNKTVDDVDEVALRKFVERGREKGRITFEYTNAAEVLDRLGLIEGDRLLNAGIALFCPSILTDLKMAIFATHRRTEILDLRHEDGLLFDLVRIGETFVLSNTRNRVDTSTPGASDVIPEIPKKAVHEALMNAYAHRDWESRSAVMVEIFNDAVEIISPGWFIDGQDPNDHLLGKNSSPKTRNGVIARTLYMSGDIESQGTGIQRIKEFCDEVNMKVEYVRVPEGTKLIFHRNEAYGQSFVVNGPADDMLPSQGVVENVVEGRNVKDNINDYNGDSNGLRARNRQVLELMLADPSITAQRIADKCDITQRTAERAIRELKESGLVVRNGSNKTGVWVVRQNMVAATTDND